MAGEEATGPPRTFADKLDHLFKEMRDTDQSEFSHEDVAQAIRKRGGPTISATYVWQLRKGLRDNPTKHHIEALCGFFGVPPAYFFDDAITRQIEQELALLSAMRNAGVKQAAMRMSGLSEGSLNAIMAMIDQARRIEGLTDET